LERWEMRVPEGHVFAEGQGHMIRPGQTINVGAPHGQQLVARGYELVSKHRTRPAALGDQDEV
jgi:hypothetical protein